MKSNVLNILKKINPKQIDMYFWECEQNISTTPKKNEIVISQYNSSKILNTKHYKIIRL